MMDLDAIRARDTEDVSTLPMLKTLAVAVDDPELRTVIHMVEDRSALLRYVDELRDALACEMDDTRNACGQLNNEIERLHSRLAEAERNEGTLLGMIHHQRDVLRECLPYLNESMAGKRPGRSADDIRAAVKALTSASADGPKGEK